MTYDLIIIGGGPAGYTAAVRAGSLGLKTAVVEKGEKLGGTCLNVGCIPSKALLASSEHFHYATHGLAGHGISVKDVSIDVSAMMKRKEKVVDTLAKGIDFLFKKNKVDRLLGTGKLLSGTSVEVTGADGKVSTIEGKNILLATGSVPVELPFMKFDGQKIISSDQAISLPKVPKSLVVIGAGAIGLELGSVWNRLGAKVDVVEFLPRIAPGFDKDVATALQRSLEKQGLTFHLNTKVKGASAGKDGVTVTAEQDGKELTFSAEIVLVAVGRKPYTGGAGLEAAGVQLTDKGRVQIDKFWQTTCPTVYAVGDIVDGPMLAHKAEAEGIAVVERLAGQAGSVNYATVPGIVYTAPEGSSVGLTEEAAKEKGIEVAVGKWNFSANGRALASDTAEGFAKVIADKKTGKLLGAHILASNASELIHECVVCMEFGGSAEDLARSFHGHPTMSEVIKEAAHLAH